MLYAAIVHVLLSLFYYWKIKSEQVTIRNIEHARSENQIDLKGKTLRATNILTKPKKLNSANCLQ